MLFHSVVFLIFFSVVLLFYHRLQHRWQNLFLLIASYVFYGYWDWRFNLLIFTSTTVDFFAGRDLQTTRDSRRRKQVLLLSVAVNLGALGFFKYYDFFVGSMATLLRILGFQPHLPTLGVLLPVGISFFTFQRMSYTIDIYRGKQTATNNFIDFALFVSFFPTLLAGPIERSRNLLPQILKPRQVGQMQVVSGLNLMLLGYFRKVAIADTLAPMVEHAFANPGALSSGELLTGIYAFAFQIYGDFSGYTDIAHGAWHVCWVLS